MDLLMMLNARLGVNVTSTFIDQSGQFSGFSNATPLIRVVERGDDLTARLLVRELGADPNHVVMNTESRGEAFWPEIGNTALLSAVSTGKESMVRLLVEELGADVNLRSPRHMRFHYYGSELERSEVLLTYTPLLFAIEKENPAMVLLLLSLGADPLVTGWTRTEDHTFICGNSLQLAEIRFDDREPSVIDAIREARYRKKHRLAETRQESRSNAEQDELARRLETVTERLNLHSLFLGKVKKHVECNICIDIPASTDKIFICQNSHIFCHWCLHRIAECPLCKVSFVHTRPIRNRLAEAIVSDITTMNLGN